MARLFRVARTLAQMEKLRAEGQIDHPTLEAARLIQQWLDEHPTYGDEIPEAVVLRLTARARRLSEMVG